MDLLIPLLIAIVVGLLPVLAPIGDYHLHLVILMLIWGFVYTAWSAASPPTSSSAATA